MKTYSFLFVSVYNSTGIVTRPNEMRLAKSSFTAIKLERN